MNLVRLSLLVATTLAGQDIAAELRFVEGLRERGMLRLAEIQCQKLEDANSLDDEQQAKVAVELAKCYTAHALHSRGPAQDELWQKALDATRRLLEAYPEHRWRLILQVQGALSGLARAELAAQEAEVGGDNNALEVARLQLRTAIRELESVHEEISQPQRRSRDADATTLSDDQLRALGRHVQYQMSRGFRGQALCYPPDSADRVNALTRAVQQLEPLGRSTVGDDLVWQSLLDEAMCQRLLKNYGLAKAKLGQLQPSELPRRFEVIFRAEQIRLALAEDRTDEALRLAESAAEYNAPEIDLACMETEVALCLAAQQQGNQRQAEQRQDQASRRAEQIRQRHGAYWAHQADLQLSRIGTTGSDQANVRMLARSAESYLRRDLPEDAAQAYIRAAQQAEALRDDDQAFALRYKAGLVEHQRGLWQPAVDRLRDASLKYPGNGDASKAHLLAAFDASSLVRQSPPGMTQSRAAQQYLALLEEHLQHWPSGDTSDTARWWLARLHEGAEEWAAAGSVYQEISADFPKQSERLDRVVHCVQRQLETCPPGDYPATVEQARDWFDRQIRNAKGGSGSGWLSQAAQHAGRLRLFFQPVDYAGAEQFLEMAVASAGNSTDAERTARCLQVVAVAGLGKYDEALSALHQAAPVPSSTLVDTLRGLQIVFDSQVPESRQTLSAVQAEVVKSLIPHRNRLEPSQRLVLETSQADALSFADRDQAVIVYRQLSVDHPQDARIQRRYAELLLGGMNRTSYQSALEQWRLVLRKSRPKTADWFQAKYGVALSHYKLGNQDQASQLIRLTEQLHPEMGGAELKRQFRRLLELCER